MKITMQFIGAENEQGARFAWSTRVEVESEEDALFAGMKFARLCDQMGDGAREWQASTVDADTDDS